MLIGLAVGTIVSPPLIAQRNGVFDKITCREIEVIDKDGNEAISLSTTGHGGIVWVSRKDGGEVEIDTDEYGGSVSVTNNQGDPRAVMGVNAFGNGVVATWDKNGYRQ